MNGTDLGSTPIGSSNGVVAKVIVNASASKRKARANGH